MNNSVHFVLQGKGGVGKSLVSSMLAQYLIERQFVPVCADTDPVNSTFHQIKGLKAALVPITEGGAVVQRLFDPLFELVIEKSLPFVIDNGASTFLPMIKYMKANEAFTILADAGKETFIHTIITGGQAKDDTVNGLSALLDIVDNTPARIVVWQNEFWGVPLLNGQALAGSPLITQNQQKILGIVKIIDRNNDAFATDLRLMSENHMTLQDVSQSELFKVFSRSRIHRVFHDVFSELDQVFQQELAYAE